MILLVGTVSTLIYFRFSASRSQTGEKERSWLTSAVAYIGKLFIAVTFGVMYAGVLMSTIIVLGQRLQELVDLVLVVIGG